MAKKYIDKTILIYICERCGYEWESRLEEGVCPKKCPSCGSQYWNKKRKNERRNQEQQEQEAVV